MICFTCAEQYMMYHKALIFNDTESAAKILKTKYPRQMKSFGRKIHGFDELVWNKHKVAVVERANLLKFTQNKDLQELLLSTEDKTLAEASPFDRVWGIGFTAENANINKKYWGQNLLGKALMKVRKDLNETVENTGGKHVNNSQQYM